MGRYPEFSVLMSVYYKENPNFFDQALSSIWLEQTVRPSQIVLVKDGVLTEDLEKVIKKYIKICGSALDVVSLQKNSGLAYALSQGLKYCKYDYIARMDTDDISTPERFEKQLTFLGKNKDIDVVGSYLTEINENGDVIKKQVNYPLEHDELKEFFSKRDPLAHPTVFFRKSFFVKAGSYTDEVPLGEDTVLWYSGFMNNCHFANIPYVGVLFRRTDSFYKRRSNWKKSIFLLKFRLLTINRNLGYNIKADVYAISYFLLSISPSFVKRIVYQYFR
ncbi:glycosyl transferase [Gallibacterium anatis str. Avicor]|uniref:glycosyltransferase n=1 Tax=Gallibacterium anatis TaxID=750 RepID=UPI0005310C73|nr:glycosyltransferase [Gallibacterium anatis]KGQ57209.1 glycosyl transferase [Gallibacterium anatis str. Avicor]